MKFLRNFTFIIFFAVFSLVTFYTAVFLAVANNAESDASVNSDAILVLGARVYIGDKFNPCLGTRIIKAVDLYKAGKAGKVIFSGGDDKEDGISEAEAMKQLAIEKGVPKEDILVEKSSTSTYENFILSKKILEQNNLKSVIIVTEPFHIKRSSLVADKLGIDYSVSPAKDSPCWINNKYFSRYLLKEPVAILAYMMQGKL